MIQNKMELISNTTTEFKKARSDILEILEHALRATHPRIFLQRAFERLDLNANRIFVVGFGKASGQMAVETENILGDRICGGVVITTSPQETKRIKILIGEHPIPAEKNVFATKSLLEVVDMAKYDDLVICLVSGGGSALLTLPKQGVSIRSLTKTNELLLKSGADINEINAVRKHLSQIKGGQLAARAHPARLTSLIISDVVGDRADTVASGPTVPDESTYADAIDILRKYDLWARVPENIRRVLEEGYAGNLADTPKSTDSVFESVHNEIILTSKIMISAAKEKAQKLGYSTMIMDDVIGEARLEGPRHLKDIQHVKHPSCLISGGELTVKVKGSGKGGPNQEFVLACLNEIAKERIVIAAVDSDGIDGFTDAAGAVADGNSLKRAGEFGLDPKKILENNDSYNFFKKMGDLIMTGKTGTNLNDLRVVLCF
ncbi:MAG TPA: glycerate kinase [Methanocellales archaeon]|nr:glycerate kinase [Methanocellales archaeon]